MRLKRRPNRVALAVILLPIGLFVLSVVMTPRPAGATQEQKYAGIDQCAACHEQVVASYKDSIHGQKGFAQRSEHACETCHGPGQAHVDAWGGKGTMKTFAAMTQEERTGLCLGCHEQGTQMNWAGSAHDARGLSCTDCHSVHAPRSEDSQLKAANESELCFSCHKQKSAQFFRASHHPMREGKVACADCHNPHGSPTEKLLNKASVTETCYECHAEKRGPFLWEHFPVREDCTTCHEAHGSNHQKMLKVKPPFLCQRCHSDTRHPGTIYDQTALRSASNRLFVHSCMNCHSTIHGSNHPSGKTFLR